MQLFVRVRNLLLQELFLRSVLVHLCLLEHLLRRETGGLHLHVLRFGIQVHPWHIRLIAASLTCDSIIRNVRCDVIAGAAVFPDLLSFPRQRVIAVTERPRCRGFLFHSDRKSNPPAVLANPHLASVDR